MDHSGSGRYLGSLREPPDGLSRAELEARVRTAGFTHVDTAAGPVLLEDWRPSDGARFAVHSADTAIECAPSTRPVIRWQFARLPARLQLYSNGAVTLDVALDQSARDRVRALGAVFLQTAENGDEHWSLPTRRQENT